MKQFYIIVVLLFFSFSGNSQTPINLNEPGFAQTQELNEQERSSNAYFESAKRARPFSLNPQIRNHQNLQAGDQIILQLFDDVIHPATVLRKATDVNGVTAVTLKLNAYQYAYAYLALSPDSYLVTVDIPEENEKYSSRSGINQPQAFMFQLDETEFQNLKCGLDDEAHIHGNDGGEAPQIPGGNNPFQGVPIDSPGLEPLNESCVTMPGTGDPANITLMIVYTPAAEDWSNSNEGGILNTINATMSNLNQTAIDNNLGITFDLVYSGLVNYTEVTTGGDLNALRDPNDGQMDEVHDIRRDFGADMVSLLTHLPGDGIGGIAYLLSTKYGSPQTAFSLTKVTAAANTSTFAHELGHNMGAMHNLYQDSDPGPTVWSNWPENNWSAGWRWQVNTTYYADLMSYGGVNEYPDGMPTIRLPIFSDPTYTHMGVPAGHPDLADNARTLREVKHIITGYREAIQYCRAEVSIPSAFYISGVSMGDITLNSGPSIYSDYTSFVTCMMPGESQILTVDVANSSASNRLKVWVDWNDDKVFDPVNELMYASTTGSSQYTIEIIAPLGVSFDNKRMRIRAYDSISGVVNSEPCGFGTFGEIEDYTIKLEAAPPCTEANVPQNLQVGNLTANTAQLSWDPEYGIDYYELRYREIGAPDWVIISSIWYPYHTIPDLNYESDYEAQVRSVCNGAPSSYSDIVNFTTSTFCETLYGIFINAYITRVRVGDIDHTSGNSGYSDFTAISTDLNQNTTYNITINNGGHEYSRAYAVWIDFNDNGVFDEPEELVWSQTMTNDPEVTGQFTIPETSVLDAVRMRVAVQFTTNPSYIPSPCYNNTGASGEAEDYTINILPFVPCEAATVPENFGVTNFTHDQATLTWDAVPGANYDVRYRETEAIEWIELPDLFTNTVTLQPLEAETEYETQVRSVCDGDTFSDYTASLIFETFPTPLEYCDAGATSTGFEKISNVTFNTINNNSTSSAGYEDFTHISTEVEKGATYPFSASFNGQSYSSDQVLVWIDFNQNGDFSDPGEQVLVTPTSTSPWLGDISIPSNALEGPTRMRVRLHDTGDGPNDTPCGNSTYGQVEDYTVIITSPGFVYENGSWSPENPVGVSTLDDDIYIMNGTTALSGNLLANNLFISEGATLSTAHTITLDGDMDNEGVLLFSSNTSSTGQLNTFTGSMTGSGQVTIERYIPARRAFRFLSSAVTTTGSINANWQEGATNATHNPNPGFGTHITGSVTGENGFDATPSGNPSLFTLDNASQAWMAAPNTDTDNINAGTPYRILVRGDRSIDVTNNSALPTNTTLRTTGVLHTGPFAVSALSETANAYNFIGNPYPAAVDMQAVLAGATNVNPTHYWVWDPTLGGDPTPGLPGGRGAYVAVNASTNTSNNPSSQANRYLQPGQAAFVQTASNGAATFSFQEQHKAVDQPQTQVFNIFSSISMSLFDAGSFANGSTASDGVLLRFSDEGSNEVTFEDAMKFYNQDENLASVNGETLLSIESRALPEVGESIPLFTNQYRKTSYVFEIALSEMNNSVVVLKDHYTGNTTELHNNDTTLYAFQVDATIPASTAVDRFEIVFEEVTLSTDNPLFGDGFILYPNPTVSTFYIATRDIRGDEVKLTVNSITGQKVFTNTMKVPSNGQLQVDIPGVSAGIYLVELVHKEGGTFTAKLIKK